MRVDWKTVTILTLGLTTMLGLRTGPAQEAQFDVLTVGTLRVVDAAGREVAVIRPDLMAEGGVMYVFSHAEEGVRPALTLAPHEITIPAPNGCDAIGLQARAEGASVVLADTWNRREPWIDFDPAHGMDYPASIIVGQDGGSRLRLVRHRDRTALTHATITTGHAAGASPGEGEPRVVLTGTDGTATTWPAAPEAVGDQPDGE